MRMLVLLAAFTLSAHAQWAMQDAHTTADLRGIDNVGGGVAWASGTNGTVLRTEDAGFVWQLCATPPGAEKLDFRGIQAFDNNTAIVMSSGKGDLSRLYKTTDGCQTWKLVFTNPDVDGFWDAVQAHRVRSSEEQTCPSSMQTVTGAILGDPAVHHLNAFDKTERPSFYLATFLINSSCAPDTLHASSAALFSGSNEAAFAASNSVLYQPGPSVLWFATAIELVQYETGFSYPHHDEVESICGMYFPEHNSSESSRGVFSFAVRPDSIERPKAIRISSGGACLKADIVAVGGDYQTPNDRARTGYYTAGGKKFQLAQTMPMGYRSAVAYDAVAKTWITVGANGTDISTDDGRNWRALKPLPGEAPDTDQHWNALSLPFVVGPKGRIGVLETQALKAK